MRDHCRGVFLKIVGRQPMICGADELLEEPPCAPRELMQEESLLQRQLRLLIHNWLADFPSNER